MQHVWQRRFKGTSFENPVEFELSFSKTFDFRICFDNFWGAGAEISTILFLFEFLKSYPNSPTTKQSNTSCEMNFEKYQSFTLLLEITP